MRYLSLVLLAILFAACEKNDDSNRVEIYLLKSFSAKLDTSYYPPVTVLSNGIPESTPLVTNQEIRGYEQATSTFLLAINVSDRFKNLGPDKAFVVVVNNQPVYSGVFHPGYMSSLRFGIATIDPILSNTELPIRFTTMTGPGSFGFLQQMDKRNDPQLLEALRSSRRLR